jgi:hypothetical protein
MDEKRLLHTASLLLSAPTVIVLHSTVIFIFNN